MTNLKSKEFEEIQMKEKIGYACGDLACNLIFQTISVFLMVFYTDVYGLNPGSVATLFLVARVWDAINDPIMGMIVDRYNPKRGKFRSYLLYGAVPFTVLSILCFTTPDFSYTGKLVYAYITYIGVGMIYTFVNVPYGALTSAITQDPIQRTSLSAIRMVFALLGGVAVSIGIPLLVDIFGKGSAAKGYQMAMIIFGSLGGLLLIYSYFSTTERVEVKETQGKISGKDILVQLKLNTPLLILCVVFVVIFGLMSITGSVGVYYMTYYVNRPELFGVFNTLGLIISLIIIPFVPKLAQTYGKKKVLSSGLLISGLASLLYYIIPSSSIILIFLTKIIVSIGSGSVTGLLWGLVPDTIEYGEYVTGKRAGGLIYSIVGFFFKIGMALGGIVPGIVLEKTGYIPNQPQTVSALQGIVLMMSVIPFILNLIAYTVFRKYELDEEKYIEILNKIN